MGCRGTFHVQFKVSPSLLKSPASHFVLHDIKIFNKFLPLFYTNDNKRAVQQSLLKSTEESRTIVLNFVGFFVAGQ